LDFVTILGLQTESHSSLPVNKNIFMLQPLVYQGLLIIEASRLHSSRTPMEEWPAWSKEVYLTTRKTQKR